MAIDPSIVLGLNQPSSNVLQSVLGATQLKGQIQAQNANKAISAAYQQATDPTTGKVNQGKLLGLISQDPNAAYNLPTIQSQILQQQNAQQEFDSKKFELANKQVGWLKNGLGSLLSKDTIAPGDLTSFAIDGIKQGLITPEQASQELSSAPQDPAQLRSWVQQHFLSAQDGETQLKAYMPQTQVINNGATQQIIAIDPLTGQPKLTGQVQNTMAPGDANSMVTIFDPNSGTQRMVTKAQAAAMANGQGAQPGYTPDTSGGSLGSGRLNPITGGAPGIQAAPALGSAEAAGVVGKGAAEQSLNLSALANAAPQSIQQFQNMREALKDINTGPGTDWRNQAASFVQALSPTIAAKINIDPQKIASAEEFKKYATQATQATLANLGEGTDSKLASAAAANPGTSLSKLGNEQLIDVLVAGQRATVAKNEAWQNSGLPPEQFNKFSTQWNKDVDPRLFTLQDMPRERAIAMRNSLKPSEQKAFDASYNKAVASGLIQRIGQ